MFQIEQNQILINILYLLGKNAHQLKMMFP